jgi:hypothetical protein
MKLFAFAALMALPLLGAGTQSASADYYCCGKGYHEEHHAEHFTVISDAVVFECDSYHCETKIKIFGGTEVKAYCRNGWCEIKNFPFAHVWVLESCLKPHYYERRREGYEGGEEGAY